MATKRLRRAKRSRRGRAPVRGAGLRPAPHHEVEVAVARGPLILRSRARRGAKDEASGTGDVNAAALYRLLAWLSPSYPIGAFSYSSGIEWAVEAGDITDADALRGWLAVVIGEGGGFCDAVFFVHAHRAAISNDDAALRAVAELAAAFSPSKERHLETTAQGRAFLDTTRAAWPTPCARSADGGLGRRRCIADRGRGRERRAWHCARARAARLPSRHDGKPDFDRPAAGAARPDRRAARSCRARAGRDGDRRARARHAARSGRRGGVPRRSRQHAPRNPIHTAVQVLTRLSCPRMRASRERRTRRDSAAAMLTGSSAGADDDISKGV